MFVSIFSLSTRVVISFRKKEILCLKIIDLFFLKKSFLQLSHISHLIHFFLREYVTRTKKKTHVTLAHATLLETSSMLRMGSDLADPHSEVVGLPLI